MKIDTDTALELYEALSDIIDDAEEAATDYAAAMGAYHTDEQVARFVRVARARAAIADAEKETAR